MLSHLSLGLRENSSTILFIFIFTCDAGKVAKYNVHNILPPWTMKHYN